jgi:hypothetical protein
MITATATLERIQEICAQRGCYIQDLFLIGDRPYMALGGSGARSHPREYRAFLLDDAHLASALPELLRRLDARVYESLDELREQHAQEDEFHALYDALYDALTDFGGGVAPDDEPLFLPGGYQGVAEILLHVQSQECLVPALIACLQAPMSKYRRRWKVRVTSGEMGSTRKIAEVYADALHAY